MRTLSLLCGILAPLLYSAMLLFIPLGWKEYSSVSQTVSELSAIGAPTRPIWVPLGMAYALLMAFFGWGVWSAAGKNSRLRKVGFFLMISALLSASWPPMHLRGEPFTATDAWHIVYSMATVLLMILSIILGALAFGPRFRAYSWATLGILVFTGILTSLEAPNIARNLPTPWIGVWERIGIIAYMVWNAALALMVTRAGSQA